ncbi:MAG: hypothetical protein EA360_05790 [Balneolaceae bacterium]|nr:MAG: hypothetical protein EA360_05790 [Balneolaceae bacterium]
MSLSGAATATPSGPAAIYFNPSLLVLEENSSAEVNYTLWIADVSNQFAAINFIRNNSALAAGFFYSGSGGFEARDTPGPSSGPFSVNYLSISAAAAHRMGPFSAGVTVQYLREEVFQYRANGFGITAGISASFMNERVRAAAALTNLGEMESLDLEATPLPTGFNAGITADFLELATSGLNDLPLLFRLHLNWHQPVGENLNRHSSSGFQPDPVFSSAISTDIGDLFVLMAGYRFGSSERPFSTGISLKLDPVRVNYGMVPFTTGFGTVHSFGLQYLF